MGVMAEPLDIQPDTLRRWIGRRRTGADSPQATRGRPSTVSAAARWAIRKCYVDNYGEWGPETLAAWVKREELGSWCAATIAGIIADLVEPEETKAPEPIRYELTAANVMWSEDGTGFKERGRKKELLVAQDEHARYKVNYKLVDGPATEDEVVAYLTEAFDRHGAPLVLKHDGAKIFHSGKVEKLLESHGVVSLTSPRYYPGYNGKMERSMRDLKQHIRAQRRYGVRANLQAHIHTAMKDLNDKRPRPVLKGSTAREVFHRDRIALPDRWAFIEEVRQAENHFVAQAASREQEQTARRRAVEAVLLNHELLEISAPVTTDLSVGNLT